MKIAVFHELPAGGARRSVSEVAKILKQKHRVDLYYVDEKAVDFEEINFSNSFFYKFIPKSWKGNNWKIKLYKDSAELYHLYKFHQRIARDINNLKYDFVIIHPSKLTQAPFILRFIQTKKVYYAHETLRIVYEQQFKIDTKQIFAKKIYEKGIRSLRKAIDNINILHADIILTNSLYTKKNIEIAYGRKSIVSYLGVDNKIFKPLDVEKDIDILFIGALEKNEGYPLLKNAIVKMKNKPTLHMHISGKDWIKSDKEFAELYSRAKIVVCLAKNEPFGLIPLEAMACGVPVIALNEGGYRETIIDGVTGYLVPQDSKIIAQKLSLLLNSVEKQMMMSKNARKHIISNWTWEKSVNWLEEFLKSEQVD